MLQRIRDNASGPLAYVVVAVIALVFGVWGIGSYFTPSSDPTVASVGGTQITRYQLQQAYNQRYQRLRQLMGDRFDPNMVPPKKLRRTVLQGLINRAVVDQYARSAGYRVTDAGLLAAIRDNKRFQVKGQFSAQRYRAVLGQAGMAPAQYEARLRNALASRQLRGEITHSAFAAPAAVTQAYHLAHQQRRARYLQFDPTHYRDQVQVTDAAIKQYYDQHADAFTRAKRVKLAYVELNRADAAKAAKPSTQALRRLYNENKAKLGTPQMRGAAQIRIPIQGDGAAARKAVEQLSAALANGKTFKAAAQTAPDSAAYTTFQAKPRDQLPTAVAHALFGLEPGQTSSPVRSGDAWYLLKLNNVVAAQTAPFDAPRMQSKLRSMAKAKRATKAYRDKSDRLESLSFQAPNDLKTLSKQLHLKIQHSGWMTPAKGAGIGQYDAVRKAAFSDAVYKDKLNSTPVKLGSDRRIVLRVTARQPSERRPLPQVRARIVKRLRARQARDKARQAARDALAKLDSGADMASLAQPDGPSLVSLGYIGRSDRKVDANIRDAVFAAAQPSADAPAYRIAATGDAKVALVAVNGVRNGANGGADQRQRFANQQRNYTAELEYAAFSAYLREHADIDIREDRID